MFGVKEASVERFVVVCVCVWSCLDWSMLWDRSWFECAMYFACFVSCVVRWSVQNADAIIDVVRLSCSIRSRMSAQESACSVGEAWIAAWSLAAGLWDSLNVSLASCASNDLV